MSAGRSREPLAERTGAVTYIRLSNEIRAPARDLFDIADNHKNYPKFFEGFAKLGWTSPRHRVGSRLRLEGRFGGAILPMEIETTEVIPGKRISGVFTSGLDGHFDWEFDSSEDTTWVTLTAEYKLRSEETPHVPDRAALDRALCANLQRTLAAVKVMGESRSDLAA